MGEYLIQNYEDNELKAQELEYWSKCYGFKAEIKEKNDGYILKIYGDSQNEVDDFINLFIRQNHRIY